MLAGNDIVGDILANYLGATNTPVDRIYEGSYNALVDLYRGTAFRGRPSRATGAK